MTMKTKVLICFGAMLCIAAVDVVKQQFEMPTIKATVKVVDEAGAPVQNAKVSFSFSAASNANTIVRVQGLTDAQGAFVAEGHSNGMPGTDITKSGYYPGTVDLHPFREVSMGRWQPWDATYTSILRPIGNPVAMYVVLQEIVWV